MQISWSADGTLVAITGEDSFYLLKFDRDAYDAALESGVEITDEGVEEAFELVAEISEGYAPTLLSSPAARSSWADQIVVAFTSTESRRASGSATASSTRRQPTSSAT